MPTNTENTVEEEDSNLVFLLFLLLIVLGSIAFGIYYAVGKYLKRHTGVYELKKMLENMMPLMLIWQFFTPKLDIWLRRNKNGLYKYLVYLVEIYTNSFFSRKIINMYF